MSDTVPARLRHRRPKACMLVALSVAALCCGLPSVLGWWALNRAYGVRHKLGWIDSERRKLPLWEPLPVPWPNAFDTYEQAAARLPADHGPDMVWDWARAVRGGDAAEAAKLLPQVQGYLAQCAPALTKMHEAAGQEYRSPVEPGSPKARPWLSRQRDLARVGAVAALDAHERGDDRAALLLIEDIYALGVKVPRGASLVEMLDGRAEVAIAAWPAADILLSGRVPPGLLRSHAESVRGIRAQVWPLYMTALCDGVDSLGSLDRLPRRAITRDELARLPSFWTNPLDEEPEPRLLAELHGRVLVHDAALTREWVEDRYARIVEELRKPIGASAFFALADQTTRDVTVRNDPLARATTDFWDKAYRFWGQMSVDLAADETISCLEACKHERSAYPATLSELVPDYMPGVPEDPWTGNPLIYRLTPERYTLYAVGPNRVDDGGQCNGRGLPDPDMVIVPVPPPRGRSTATQSGP